MVDYFFLTTCSKVLNKQAPCKKKYIQGNERPFMNKDISKENTMRSKLRSKFSKTRNDTDKFNYNKQRNFCVFLIRKEKTRYVNLNIKDMADNFGQILENY